MNDPEKFRMVAESLRELVTEPRFRQCEVLALLTLFERLASEAEAQRELELDAFFGRQNREH